MTARTGEPDDNGDGVLADRPNRRRAAFFGRVAGKTLRPGQAALFRTVLPGLQLDLAVPPPANLAVLFAPTRVEAVRLEIGVGGGEHVLAEADRFPGIGFVAAEVFRNGLAKLLADLAERPRPNLRIHPDDAVPLLDWLPAAGLAGIDLLYPDPWPKRKQWKRRFVSPANLDRFARALKPGAPFRFASDVGSYVEWTRQHVAAHAAFSDATAEHGGPLAPFPGWPGTRYEAKALREGRPPAYLTFRRR